MSCIYMHTCTVFFAIECCAVQQHMYIYVYGQKYIAHLCHICICTPVLLSPPLDAVQCKTIYIHVRILSYIYSTSVSYLYAHLFHYFQWLLEKKIQKYIFLHCSAVCAHARIQFYIYSTFASCLYAHLCQYLQWLLDVVQCVCMRVCQEGSWCIGVLQCVVVCCRVLQCGAPMSVPLDAARCNNVYIYTYIYMCISIRI